MRQEFPSRRFAGSLELPRRRFTTGRRNLLDPAGSGGKVVDGSAYSSANSLTVPWNGGEGTQPDANVPKAFLNYLWINRAYDTATVRFKSKPISAAAFEDGTPLEGGTRKPHELLEITDTVSEAGYVYIYLSNDGEEVKEVYFDDFKVEHVKSPVIQSEDYYPFGLTFNGYQREDGLNNPFQYNGKEMQDEGGLGWLDYGARMYIPEIGRWTAVDPHAYDYSNFSPYVYALSNPLNVIDPTGKDAIYTVARNKKEEITGLNISSTVYITGDGTSEEMADALTAGATATFKEKTVNGVTISFSVTYKHDADGGNRKLSKGENLLTFHASQGISGVRSKTRETTDQNGKVLGVEMITATRGDMYRNRNGQIPRQDVLHETLHFLGLSDRYSEYLDENGNRAATTNVGFKSDIMGDNTLRIGDTHYRLYGKFFSTTTQNSGVLNRHIDVDSRGNLLPPTLDEMLKFVPTPIVVK